jgi:hypothetical protein
MTQQEIVAALRALADKMEQGGKQVAPSVSVAQARFKAAPPPPAGAQSVSGKVGFWDVKIRENGKPMASVKLTDGRRFVCFDQKIIEAADPLMRGDEVTISLKEWTKKDGTTDVLICGIQKGAAPKQGISDDEIPF